MIAVRAKQAWPYVASFGCVVLITLGSVSFLSRLHQSSILLLYLLLVLVTATWAGMGPAITTAVLAFLGFTFFFAAPVYSWMIDAPEDALALSVFMIVAVTASSLTGQVRKQAVAAQHQADQLAALYQLSQTISAEVDAERMLPSIAETAMRLARGRSCQILLHDADGQLCERANVGAAAPADVLLETPIQNDRHNWGVLRVTHQAVTMPPESLHALAAQLALALERARLFDAASHARAHAESNHLKSALLLSVSHDLRTPLAVIKGIVTNLLDDAIAWDHATQREFFRSIDTQTTRLNRFVDNLLHMARIEAGKLHLARSWQDMHDLVGAALEQARPLLAGHTVTLDLPTNLPLVQIDCTQIEQVLINLVENAGKYTLPGTPIHISAWADRASMYVAVRDSGPGVPPHVLPHLFERFVRGVEPEQTTAGTGLGLAICKGLIEAHGGRIWAENMPAGGARFVYALPLPAQQARPYQEAANAA